MEFSISASRTSTAAPATAWPKASRQVPRTHRRKEFVLSTKVGELFENGESRYEFDRDSVQASVAVKSAATTTDELDVVLIHTPADDVRVLNETPVVETLQALKAAGKIRAIGLSGKTVAAGGVASPGPGPTC